MTSLFTQSLCGGSPSLEAISGHNAYSLACTIACLKMTETSFTLIRTIKSRGPKFGSP
jgi:hypothetical protein